MKSLSVRKLLLPVMALSLLSCLPLSACSDEDVEMKPTERYFINSPLQRQGHLRVLAIGNSYTSDATRFVADLLKASGVSDTTYSVYSLTYSAATLEHWWTMCESGEEVELNYVAGHGMKHSRGPMSMLLAQDWDVITLQQYSGAAIKYSTFNPWLRYLISYIRARCTNPDVTLAWQMAWSYADGYASRYRNLERWALIVKAVKQMNETDGIDVIIPAGTAIQNARNTELNTQGQLTRDGTHLDRCVGRYIAACSWVEALFGPVYGITVAGNPFIPNVEPSATEQYPAQPMTPETAALAQRCAVAAVASPFAVSAITNGFNE